MINFTKYKTEKIYILLMILWHVNRPENQLSIKIIYISTIFSSIEYHYHKQFNILLSTFYKRRIVLAGNPFTILPFSISRDTN